MPIEAVRIQPQHQAFLDEHFSVTPKWEEFHKKLKNKSFVDAVQSDTRSDDKLKAFTSAVSMRDQAKGPSVKAPSDVSGSYKVKYHPEADRFSCTCPDWTYKRSVSGADCKHIQRIKDSARESLMNKTKQATVAPIDVMFRVGRAINREQKDRNVAERLKAENSMYSAAYPQQSLITAFLKKASDIEWAKKMGEAARSLIGR